MPSKLSTVCLVCSITGILLIYIAARAIEPTFLEINEINFEFTGRQVRTSGYVVYKKIHPAGHIFLTISDGKERIQVPLFAGYVSSLRRNGFPVDKISKGAKISVTGLVDEYRGQLQIIPRKYDDIKILG